MMSTETSRFDTSGARYGGVAMALHWSIALLIFVQLGTGWWLNEWVPDHSAVQDQIQWWHVSFGLSLLFLVVFRVIWRLLHRPPPLDAGLASWERGLASFTHVALYALMLAQPLAGWALMTTRAESLSLFGIAVPYLPGVPQHARALSGTFKHIHIFWLVWAYVIALGAHVAGALKHQFDGHPVLWRMAPFMNRPR